MRDKAKLFDAGRGIGEHEHGLVKAFFISRESVHEIFYRRINVPDNRRMLELVLEELEDLPEHEGRSEQSCERDKNEKAHEADERIEKIIAG